MSNHIKYFWVFEREGVHLLFCRKCHSLCRADKANLGKHLDSRKSDCYRIDQESITEVMRDLSLAGIATSTETDWNGWLNDLTRRFANGIDFINGPNLERGVGFGCGHCGFVTPDKRRVPEHCKDKHKDEAEKSIIGNVHFMTFVSNKIPRHVRLKEQAPANHERVGLALRAKAWVEAVEVEATVVKAQDHEPNKWLKDMKFIDHLDGFAIMDLPWLLEDNEREPNVHSQAILFAKSLQELCEQAQKLLQSAGLPVNVNINRRAPADNNVFNTVGHNTLVRYVSIWKKLITYAMRMATKQTDALGANGVRCQPVILTDRQLTSIGQVLVIQDYEPDKRQEIVLDAIWTILDHELRDSEFASVAVSGLAILGIWPDDGRWKTPSQYGSSTPLGATLKIARLVVYTRAAREVAEKKDDGMWSSLSAASFATFCLFGYSWVELCFLMLASGLLVLRFLFKRILYLVPRL